MNNNPRIGFIFIQLALELVVVSPVQAQQPQEFSLKVTPAEVDLIGKGLGSMPFNDVAPLINKLRAQVMEQQKLVEQKPTATEPKKE